MGLKKGLVLGVLCMGFFLVLRLGVSGRAGFTDVGEGDWFHGTVLSLATDGRRIVQGYPDGSFRPQGQLSADQFVALTVRALGNSPENGTGYWAQPAIDKALELGLLLPGEIGDYRAPIDRQKMARILVRALELSEGTGELPDFGVLERCLVDSRNLEPATREAVLAAYGAGILGGYPDHTFRPAGILTRAEACTVVERLLSPDKRLVLEPERIREEIRAAMGAQLYGGAEWVDPVEQEVRERIRVDMGLLESGMKYTPNEISYSEGSFFFNLSSDNAYGEILYNRNGPLAGHVEDFKRLLQRRLPEQEVIKVMTYLRQKENYQDLLPEEDKVFYLDQGRYLVRLTMVVHFKENPTLKGSPLVGFSILFRDKEFIEKYERYVVE
ncbi:S-layer homology domain-containing protein [Anaerotalea alkaliphila]|uniref:S-layer homology domain-containing protein n=1 Tax=Anaerotalea alkaliphila TaxID=2662126 RepID=A0A7X5HTJ2_9FIRM|nr:S-layer homology domain-containing protein [Anaerotalea alkaliphila]NDL66390.1 S-layer homology domain-containing protein [Anaerotalea alkaliphila]